MYNTTKIPDDDADENPQPPSDCVSNALFYESALDFEKIIIGCTLLCLVSLVLQTIALAIKLKCVVSSAGVGIFITFIVQKLNYKVFYLALLHRCRYTREATD